MNAGFANRMDAGPPSTAAELRPFVTLQHSLLLVFIPALLQVRFIIELELKACLTQNFELFAGK